MPAPDDRPLWMTDGQLSWEAGIDSNKPPTIASQEYPEGLKRTQLAWMGNATVRNGRISPRAGFEPLVQGQAFAPGGFFQGAYLYEPNGADPHIIMGVGGHTFQVRVDNDNSVHDLTQPGTLRESGQPQWWMKQGERFLVIQDGSGEPSVWDGVDYRRITAMGGSGPYLPVGTAMDYFMGRMWVARVSSQSGGREYVAGDIVLGPSGTPIYGLRDSILHMKENTYLAGGGAFTVPANDSFIRSIFHTAELDTTLGTGRLYVGTRKSIYAVNVPVTRTDWNLASNINIPLQTVAQLNWGTVGDRSVVPVNSDVFYQTLEPGIRSLTLATRYFQQWGNTQISVNEQRVLQLNDRALLRFSSGTYFDNRLLQSCLPFQTPVGVAHRGIIPLDFNLISSLGEKYPPAWEGMIEGLDVLQLLSGDFGGRERCFAIAYSRVTNQIEIWEITRDALRDGGVNDARVSWFFELPAYTWAKINALKKLVSGELWIDNLFGTVEITVEYRPDTSPCWILWHKFKDCLLY